MKAAITATAKYLPDDILSNQDLEKILDTSDEWIRTRTGISERRILKDPEKATSFLCSQVAERIIEKRGISAEEIDLIIVATMTPDMIFPSTACLVQKNIGASNAWAFDLSGACSGFLFALNTGSQFIAAGTHRKVLVIGGEKMSSVMDYTDRNTCVLFGDGAAGVLLEPAKDENHGMLDAKLHADGRGGEHLYMQGGGSRHPATHETVDGRMHYLHQDGKQVFKSAVTAMADIAVEIMERNNLVADDVSYLIPHQANKRIIQATAERMGIDMAKVAINIDKYGNTSAATIPICIAELDEARKLQPENNLILVSFGAGYTWGGIYLKWQ
ncbi:MAG: ketoacyl-ACP synthase III [Prosthecochloris sp.]|uniref:Beta-ketoacyl-[acyl-carrier-protein] synthase III n=1 Tax=Prosthecochloris aestuarii (strain DSM 271 / SK 413) TaxID=290512 RepID=B4S3P0_PROA2|nr:MULTISPECIES: beta-ketoacyl-ACP synthase III [Prosthecochloris]ACF45236.1 3-oxoacyl-(acyl-carrier-protein) synthase III [Prosthecochloris aestuarii DSM 271]MCW8798398.1 ketoacyl-ACP synthase III [Prosthecochloris sp.]NEX12564.1 ketoacyl-ACP synthase III [Prosthecochloris sp.]RDD31110.1 ketoacyl-ACP synthase III [Prosthecochloris sp. ZM]